MYKTCFVNRAPAQQKTYTNNNKVQTSPGTSEVSPESKGHPFQDHFNCEKDCKDHIDNRQDQHQLFIVLKVDVFKAQGKAEIL